jgi:hypothetical protein
MKIDVLVLDGAFDTGLSAMIDLFATATAPAATLSVDAPTSRSPWWACGDGGARHRDSRHPSAPCSTLPCA